MTNAPDNASTEPSPAATLDPERCQFYFSDGRRCRSQRWETHPALCISHAREQAPGTGSTWSLRRTKTQSRPSATPDFTVDLTPLSGEFRTATDVNRALGKLFSLLAQNRIP